MDIEIRPGVPPHDAVLALYDSVGWTAYTAQPDQLRTALENSRWVVGAWEGERLVGLARGISDDAVFAWLQDVLIVPERQRHGLGRRLVGAFLERFAHCRQRLLLTDQRPEQVGFYRALGLKDVGELGLIAFVVPPEPPQGS